MVIFVKKIGKSGKNMNLDYKDSYKAILDIDNPYCYNFGSNKKEHIHTDAFDRLQNKVNFDYYDKR